MPARTGGEGRVMEREVDTEALARALAKEIGPAIAATFEDAARIETLRRRPYLNSEEVALLYGLNANTLKTWRCIGKGPAFIRDGRVILYDQKDLQEYVAARRVRTGEQRS